MGPRERSEKVLFEMLTEKGEMTTSEIEREMRGRGEECPDGAVKGLMRLKVQGRIEGRMDKEKRGWVWSIKTDHGP